MHLEIFHGFNCSFKLLFTILTNTIMTIVLNADTGTYTNIVVIIHKIDANGVSCLSILSCSQP